MQIKETVLHLILSVLESLNHFDELTTPLWRIPPLGESQDEGQISM